MLHVLLQLVNVMDYQPGVTSTRSCTIGQDVVDIVSTVRITPTVHTARIVWSTSTVNNQKTDVSTVNVTKSVSG